MTASRPAVNFGTVRVGAKATAYIHVTNGGNTSATVAGTAPLPAPFGEPLRAAVNLPVGPGYDLRLPVSFTPARPGRFTARYRLSWTDLHGRHALVVAVTGTAGR